MMTILWIIYFACIIAWALPPFKQYKTRYFFYFLALALSDPFTALMPKLFDASLWYGHVTTTSILIILLISIDKPKRLLALSVGLVFILSLLFFNIKNDITLHNIMAFNILVVSFLIAKDFVIDIKGSEKINLFYLVLLLYNISGIMKHYSGLIMAAPVIYIFF
jgi:hypothetical protein